MTNILLLLVLLLGVAWIILAIQSLLKTLNRRKRLAALRRNPEQVPLSSEQPLPLLILTGELTLPVLTKQISRGAHLILLAVWFSISVLITLTTVFPGSNSFAIPVKLSEALGLWSACWIVAQGTVTLGLYQRIETSESGLLVQQGVIRRRISWNQACLFAMDTTNFRGKPPNQFELSSTQQIVRWEWEPKGSQPQFTFQPAPPEYRQELERLLSYIHERTALPLRDLRYC
ncbi:MAG: hypothetical protein M3Z08_21815 [Chloroflexota bacterium]|nr:hypothetical protein [Chloroflexota bacterium]